MKTTSNQKPITPTPLTVEEINNKLKQREKPAAGKPPSTWTLTQCAPHLQLLDKGDRNKSLKIRKKNFKENKTIPTSL